MGRTPWLNKDPILERPQTILTGTDSPTSQHSINYPHLRCTKFAFLPASQSMINAAKSSGAI